VAHLLNTRKGWENEKLAAYLLSRFSFVAQPTSIADDLGSDFFCTIFEIQNSQSGAEVIVPRSSFAVQVKSSADIISMDNKMDYLSNLEIPFFIGVLNQQEASMRVYSAELLPFLFAHVGTPDRLSILLSPPLDLGIKNYVERSGPDSLFVRLRCPQVAEFRVNEDRLSLNAKVEALHRICERTQYNIAARRNEEHIYDIDGKGDIQILAGQGSAKHFRENLMKRLGEVFVNLDWHLNAGVPKDQLRPEFRAYENLYRELRDIYGELPFFVSGPYQTLSIRFK